MPIIVLYKCHDMFTRKNIAIALMIYLLFFLFLLTLLGENGILARAELRRNAVALEGVNKKKAADILLLREEKANKDYKAEDGELLYSFDDLNDLSAEAESIIEYSEFEAMSKHEALLIALLPTLLYFLIVFVAGKRRKK